MSAGPDTSILAPEPTPTESIAISSEVSANLNEVWTKDNFVEKLRTSDVLEGDAAFVDKKNGNYVAPAEDPTNIKNAIQLTLTVDVDGLDKDFLENLAYRIYKRVYEQKRDFQLANVYIAFIDKNGNENKDWANFSLGINVIAGFFKNSKIVLDPHSFFSWIEQHFVLPEDKGWLMENDSWTTLSDKSRP